jgi:type I restriction enzyme M protein
VRLGAAGLSELAEQLKRLDPDGSVVRLDVAKQEVWYAPQIVRHEDLGAYTGEEEPVRAFIIAHLVCELGYDADAIELEKRYPSGRSNIELDIRLATADKSKPYALIEVKAPSEYGGDTDPLIDGQLFSPATREPGTLVLSLATVRKGRSGEFQLEAITIDHSHWSSYRSWASAGRPHRSDFPLNYDLASIEPLARGTDRDLDTEMTRAEFDRLRRTLHDRLWGGSNDDNAIYAWLIRLFLTKIRDEKVTNDGEPYACQILHNGAEREPIQATLQRVNARWRDAAAAYAKDLVNEPGLTGGIFSNEDVIWAVETIQNISLTSASQNNGDILGAFFEAITRDGFKQSKGLFFTHYNLACFMVAVLDIPGLARKYAGTSSRHTNERFPYIIDPSCGSGTFLLATMRMVTSHLRAQAAQLTRNADTREVVQRWLPEYAPNTWAAEFLYGIDKRQDLAMSTMVNMVLHQDGHTHIYRDDTLSPLEEIATRHQEEKFRTKSIKLESGYEFPVTETMDVVITNPPFGSTPDGSVRPTLSRAFELADERNTENLFVERWFQLLKPHGRLAAVLPESFFSTPENARARRFLLAHFHVRAVVSLPPHAFQPWTPTRTSLLFAQKKAHKESRRWTARFNEVMERNSSLLAEATRAIKRLISPRKSDSEEILGSIRKDVERMLDGCDFDVAVPDLRQEASLPELLQELSRLDPNEPAFRITANEQASADSYIGMAVREIGYRRTKRGEATKKNDLFCAEALTAGGAIRVRNLNEAADGWNLVVAGDGEDALSQLRREITWA